MANLLVFFYFPIVKLSRHKDKYFLLDVKYFLHLFSKKEAVQKVASTYRKLTI